MSDLTTEIKKLEIETLDNLKLSKAKKIQLGLTNLILMIFHCFVLNTV